MTSNLFFHGQDREQNFTKFFTELSLQNELRAGNRRRDTMSESEMQAELERLRAENAQLKSKDKGGLTLKVSEKGGLPLYGMGRFPVTLYKEQWLRILASAPEIVHSRRRLQAEDEGVRA